MASGTFFASWELWQQMTFVLAMGIALVFLIGLMKLWWTNRHMKMIEQLDAEKQERAARMRRPWLSNKRRARRESEIPFGVKALESGAEVDGVWVVRMASMASRPSDRKWSSKRKISQYHSPLFHGFRASMFWNVLERMTLKSAAGD
jgi:hypothetical protein